MGSVCLVGWVFFVLFSFTDFAIWTLIASRPGDTFFAVADHV